MKTVLLVDLSALFRAAWHANAEGPTSISFQATLDAVRRCQTLVGDSPLVAICCDGRGNWRKALSPDYKAHREKQPEAMYGVLDRIKAKLAEDGYLLWQCDGYEADDLLAGATEKAVAAGHPVVIASHDKDITQLVSDGVRMLKTSTWEFVGPAEVVAKFGVEPAGIADLLALTGDSSDGIKGIPSVGPKTARDLLLKHFSLEGIFAKVDALQVMEKDGVKFVETKTPAAAAIGTPAIVDKLWRHKADALLARKLVELRTDAPIKFEDIHEERRPMTKHTTTTVDLDGQGDIFAREDAKAEPPKDAQPAASATPSPGATPAEPVASASASPSSESPSAPPASAPSDPAPNTASTALVPVEVEYIHALEPRSPAGALTLGQVLYESRAYSRFPTAGSITATIMRGRELGITALASLDAFHFVAEMGRILPSWQVIVTLAEQSPDCEYFRWVEGDDKSQTWATKHRKHPVEMRLTYKIEQAERAGLIKPDKPKSAWMARPDEMLRKTAACQLARIAYPGATLGLYAAEEMSDAQ